VKANVPQSSTLLSATAWTYRNYLYADGIDIAPIDSTQVAAPVLVNAYSARESTGYVLLTDWLPPDEYASWFAEWDRAYPDRPWIFVAQDAGLGLSLYRLSAQ
jgi:hypothetical protein